MPEVTWGIEDAVVRLGGRVVLDGVTLTAQPGSIVAVVGGDGAGKSTLLRLLAGRVRPASGTVRVPERTHVGYQPATSGTWAALSVRENLDLVARAYRLSRDEASARVRELLHAAGLTEAADRPAAQLSGGMRQKLGFCMAMLPQPELLLLDEPSTGVDPVSRVELWALVSDAAARGTAVVMATTYLDEAERAHQVLVLDDGHAIAAGTPADVRRDAPGSITTVDRPVDPTLAWSRGTRLRQWLPDARLAGVTDLPDLEDAVIAATFARGGRAAPVEARPRSRAQVGDGPVIAAEEMVRRYGRRRVVDDVTFSVGRGEIVGLIGANGAGKTTVIKLLLGLIAPDAGRALLLGGAPQRRSRARVGYVPQGLGLYPDLTVAENLDFAAQAYAARAELDAPLSAVARELVGSVGLGMSRRLAFTCALAHRPEVLILDEPTSGVDPLARARLWDTIHAEADAGVGVLVSTHYMQEAEQCDRLVLLDAGRVAAIGSVADIVAHRTCVEVTTPDWAGAFVALRRAGAHVSLDGNRVRVVDATPDEVAATLRAVRVEASVATVPATLEETLTAIVGSRRPASR